jgi:hypothetical protein
MSTEQILLKEIEYSKRCLDRELMKVLTNEIFKKESN